MIKSSLRHVSTIQWKIFLSNQVNFSDWSKMLSSEIEYGTHFSLYSRMLVQFICKLSVTVQWYFPRLQSKINENQPLDWLRDIVYDWATKSASSKTNKQKISAVQLGSGHDNTMNKWRRHSSTGRKKRWKHWQIQFIFTQRNQYRARIFVNAKRRLRACNLWRPVNTGNEWLPGLLGSGLY